MATENYDLRTLAIPRDLHQFERYRARRAVARWATGVSDARELLDMLDLTPREGEPR